ncbi:olfactory receptor 183-like [Perognathus longimembris pacificus]|uniref:olfactory receptor 183-like n=1 Tax=Perognathus longimembris pacificus TaxID=214514 RepID=UPI002019387D|nr:olfactory receptor 183-like [Perognathus longimembris pacificus]
MEKENTTVVTEFVLAGLTHQPQWKIPLFLFFFVVYLMTILGNLSLIGLIWKDSHLHIPMYLCLGNLAFVDAWLSSTVTPNMLLNLLDKNKLMYFSECMIQFFSFVVSATAECFILAVMAYDRYVAICKPLLYPVIMTYRLCMQLLALSYIGGFIHAVIHESFLLRLAFCKSNIIHHFYCDVIPLLMISCTDPSLNYLMLFIFSGSVQVFSIMTILISYTFVLLTVLTTKSEKGMRKTLSTCGAHLLSVSLYYGPLLFMYVHPAPSQTDDQDMIFSLFYTVIIPVLNPIIYSLRNKQVIGSLKKILKRNG